MVLLAELGFVVVHSCLPHPGMGYSEDSVRACIGLGWGLGWLMAAAARYGDWARLADSTTPGVLGACVGACVRGYGTSWPLVGWQLDPVCESEVSDI